MCYLSRIEMREVRNTFSRHIPSVYVVNPTRMLVVTYSYRAYWLYVIEGAIQGRAECDALYTVCLMKERTYSFCRHSLFLCKLF